MAAIVIALLGPEGSTAASSSTVVSATIPSATRVDASGCPSHTPDITSFGTVLPGGSFVTAQPCIIEFGSSNDTASLRVQQADRAGAAMHQLSSLVIDSGWGTGGSSNFDIEPSNDDAPEEPYVDPATSLTYVPSTTGVTPNRDLAVTRLLTDGSVDATFGVAGTRTYDLGGDEVIQRIVRAPDGKLLVFGAAEASGLIGKIEPDGTLVTSFGTNGWKQVTAQVPGGAVVQDLIAMPADGYVLEVLHYPSNRTAFQRLDESLEPIFSWGIDSWSILPAEQCTTTIVLANGSIACAGKRVTGVKLSDAVVMRIDPDGTLDTTFSGNGIMDVELGSPGFQDEFFGLAEHHGALYAGGYEEDATDLRGYVVRVDASGNFDPTFGTGGILELQVSGLDAAMPGFINVVDAEGSIHVFGYGLHPVDGFVFFTARLGAGQSVTTNTRHVQVDVDVSMINDVIKGGVASSDGSILLAGLYDDGGGDFATGIARLDTTEALPDYDDGNSDWNDGAAFFGVCAASVSNATADWSLGPCTGADGPQWRALPTGGVDSHAAHSAVASTSDATLDLHFGMRLSASAAPGDYVAAIGFEVVAPDA
jgi:uncharacterized delta-60 repeat protein